MTPDAALQPCSPAALRPCGPAALRPCGIYASTPKLRFWTTVNNLSAMHLGCLLQNSHF
jgi:hypothetical protein